MKTIVDDIRVMENRTLVLIHLGLIWLSELVLGSSSVVTMPGKTVYFHFVDFKRQKSSVFCQKSVQFKTI
jgi:hypothetical protein